MKGWGIVVSVSVAMGAITALAGSVAPRGSTITPITIKGNAFFAGSERFYIRGVDYQPGGSSDPDDPIADLKKCQKDIIEFKKLKINTVRVYIIDNSKDHTDCMNALADAGIYLALDVNTPKYSIRQDKPAQSYNHEYLQNVFATVEQFAKYPNTLLFFSGNEVINNVPTSAAAPWVKAVTRDIKQFIGTRGLRSIPVGYSAADIDDNRLETAEYMNCGTDDQRVDFFAFNDYSWCDPTTFEHSNWAKKVVDFKDYSVPLFLSEYGCTETARNFEEVSTLYSDKMSSVYSGGLVYEYTVEGDAKQQKFGLVDVSGSTLKEQPDFATLQNIFAKTSDPSGDGGYKPSGSASQCPPRSDTFLVDNDNLPAMPQQAETYLKNGAGTGAGFSGSGSQDLGAEGTTTATAGSGKVTETASGAASSSTKKGEAGHLRAPEMSFAPLVCGFVVFACSLLGATLL